MVRDRKLHRGRRTYPLNRDANAIPIADDTWDIGSSTRQWKDLYVDGIAYLDDVRAEVNFRAPTASATVSGIGSIRVPSNKSYIEVYVSGAAAHVWASVALA